MLKKTLSLTFLGLFGFSSTAFADEECKNDPRLFTVGHVISQIKAGEKVKPIKMNASTFLNLTEPVREGLGDNIMVYNDECIPAQIYGKKLASKVSVPFEELLLAVEWAFIRNDTKAVQTLINQFRPTARTTADILSMTGPIGWSEKTLNTAFSFGWLRSAPKRSFDQYTSNKAEAKCFELRAIPSLVELFAKLGGSTSDNILVSYRASASGATYQILSAENQYMNTSACEVTHPKTLKSCSTTNVDSVIGSMQSVGIRTTNSGSKYDEYEKMKAWLNKAYPKESKPEVQ